MINSSASIFRWYYLNTSMDFIDIRLFELELQIQVEKIIAVRLLSSLLVWVPQLEGVQVYSAGLRRVSRVIYGLV